MTADSSKDRKHERMTEATTFSRNLSLLRHPPTLVLVLAIVIPLAGIGVVFLPPRFQSLPAAIVGVPAVAWAVRRNQGRRRTLSEAEVDSRLVQEWLDAISTEGEQSATEAIERWRRSRKMSGEDVERYSRWHRLRIQSVVTASLEAAEASGSMQAMEDARREAALRSVEFETHLRWIKRFRMI